MMTDDMDLSSVHLKYLQGRDIVPGSLKNTRSAIKSFSANVGGLARVSDLNPETINKWLSDEVLRVSRRTARNYRAAIVTLWRWCYVEERLTDVPPLRIRLIKAPLPPVAAYTKKEVESLLQACDLLTNKFLGGRVPVQRKLLYRAFILVAWHTAFRTIDLMRLRWSNISDDGCVRIVQSKTGQPITRWLDQDAMGAIEAIQMRRVDLVFGKFTSLYTLREVFPKLRESAGISRGTPKWIRRAAGTQIAISYGEEAASRVLGHKTADMARKHYIDASQLLIGQLRLPRLRRFKGKRGVR